MVASCERSIASGVAACERRQCGHLHTQPWCRPRHHGVAPCGRCACHGRPTCSSGGAASSQTRRRAGSCPCSSACSSISRSTASIAGPHTSRPARIASARLCSSRPRHHTWTPQRCCLAPPLACSASETRATRSAAAAEHTRRAWQPARQPACSRTPRLLARPLLRVATLTGQPLQRGPAALQP